MSSSTKRKALCLSEGDADRVTPHGADARAAKKGKQDRAPSSGPRRDLPTTTRYLPLAIVGSHWCGKTSLENAVVFGSSFSKWYEEEGGQRSKTWIDHVQEKRLEPPMRVHNFAFPGATAEEDLSTQFCCFKDSSRHLALGGESTVYFLFLGTNDCGRTSSDELEPIVETIFDTLHDLYIKFDARNFVLIDVPPIDRSPGAMESGSTEDIKERVEIWNTLLRSQAEEFAKDYEKATVFVFSSHQVLTEILDEPLDFDFAEDDPGIGGAGIWKDDLHLTSAVHVILAERLLGSLIADLRLGLHKHPVEDIATTD